MVIPFEKNPAVDAARDGGEVDSEGEPYEEWGPGRHPQSTAGADMTTLPATASDTTCPTSCPHLHTPEEVSDLIRGAMKARTLRDKAGRQEIPCTRVGRAIRFSHADIDQLIHDGASGRPAPRRDSRRRS